MKFVEPITLPQSEFGIDWGRPRKLLVRKGDKVLFIVPGHSGWGGRGRTTYNQTKWTLYSRDGVEGRGGRWQNIHSGRMNKDAMSLCAVKIHTFFGLAGIAGSISTKHTILLD